MGTATSALKMSIKQKDASARLAQAEHSVLHVCQGKVPLQTNDSGPGICLPDQKHAASPAEPCRCSGKDPEMGPLVLACCGEDSPRARGLTGGPHPHPLLLSRASSSWKVRALMTQGSAQGHVGPGATSGTKRREGTSPCSERLELGSNRTLKIHSFFYLVTKITLCLDPSPPSPV